MVASPGTGDVAAPVVDSLNHVTTRMTVPEAKRLFAALKSLGLVVAWPFLDFGPFQSGGIRLGNLNIEVMGADPAVVPMPSYLSFAPVTTSGLVAELDRRGVAHGPLRTTTAGGRVLYATVGLSALESESFSMQLSQQFVPPHYGPSPIAPRNDAGIVDVQVVNVFVGPRRLPDFAALMAPQPVGRGMVFAEGPLINLRQQGGFRLGSLVVRVLDVPAALRAFARIGLEVQGTRVTVGTLTLAVTPASSSPWCRLARRRPASSPSAP